jgi:hypothetical protein
MFLVVVLTVACILAALGGCDTTQRYYGDQPIPHICDDLSSVRDTPVTYMSRQELSDLSLEKYGARADNILGMWVGPQHCQINARSMPGRRVTLI